MTKIVRQERKKNMLRFSCEKALLQSAVNTVSRAVAANDFSHFVRLGQEL